jgi:hypothetical protein
VTGSVPVQAAWALWSKRPGTRDDYSVLAASAGLFSPGEFTQLLKYFTAGNPSAESDTPASLPWVVLSRVGVNDQLYLGISVQVPTGDKDGTGRPISSTSYFCVPYADLARHPVSFDGLYEVVAGRVLPPDEGSGPVTLEIRPLDPAALARTVRKFGGETVAATAAMVLGGPVTVTGPGFPDLRDRLLFFDAVAALLPYGYRSHLTAASWSDTAAGERFRIVFAHRAREEASQVSWGASPRLSADGLPRAYLDYLRRALAPADGEDDQLERLIDHLARDSEPRKFEEPAHALASLHGFFLPAVVSAGLDAGDVPHADIRRVFETGQVRELPAARRTQLLERLISFADPQDAGLIIQWFDEIAVGDPGELLAQVAIACRGPLWSAGSAELARDYLPFMSQRGLADELLGRLAARPDPGPEDQEPGLDAVGQLLADFVIGTSAGPASYPRTQRALAANAAAGAALLTSLAASRSPVNRSLESAARWLEPVAGRVVRPFVSLLGDALGRGTPEPVDTAALSELNRDGGHASVRCLLRAASYRDRLHLVLPGLASWLVWAQVERSPVTEQASRYWREMTMELTPASPDEAAWLDLVLLATRNEPRALLSGEYGQPQFSQRLAAAWRELTVAAEGRDRGGNAADALLERALIGVLGRMPWRADQAQTAAVRHLARSLTADVSRPRLVSVVLDAREALRYMPPGAPPDRIAQACARAYAERLRSEQAGEALSQSGAITSAAQATEVLDSLHRALLAADARDSSYTWVIDFAAMFAKGIFGEKIAADFPTFAARSLSDQILFRIKLLEAVARNTGPDAPPAIDAPLADYLDRNRQDLEAVIRDARKRQSRGVVPGWIRGRGGAG